MKVSTDWLKSLVNLNIQVEGLYRLLPLRTIGLKEVTSEYFELDMKGYNRADLLSLRGVALEVSALTGSPLTFDEPNSYIWEQADLPTVDVLVENQQLVPLYCIAKIEGLKVNPSSPEWVKRLTDSGMRSINNLADITNLVMLEFGQPLHAFDAAKIKDQSIIVRTAKDSKKLVTLDNKTRNLEPTDLLITDPEKAVGLAGVMGGKESEVSESTDTILLEAAIFDPIALRKTTQRLSLQSEASKRFQHGLTKQRLFQSLDAAIKMYQDLGGKLTAVSIVGDISSEIKKINFDPEKARGLIGVDIPDDQIKNYLQKLYFQVDTGAPWTVAIPYFRKDISLEADLIEEVARLYGYENIPAKELSGDIPAKVDQSLFDLISKLKSALVDSGLDEVQTYSFYSTDVLNNLEGERGQLVRVANPMSAETEYLRDNLWPNLLEKTIDNLKFRNDVAVFEIGKVYISKTGDRPEEKYRLAIALSNGTSDPLAELNHILNQLDLDIRAEEDSTDSPLIHPTRHLALLLNNHQIGILAEVHQRVVNRFGSEKRIAVAELDINSLGL